MKAYIKVEELIVGLCIDPLPAGRIHRVYVDDVTDEFIKTLPVRMEKTRTGGRRTEFLLTKENADKVLSLINGGE